MKLRILPVLLVVAPALVAACGGSATDELAPATPSFDSMSMDISDLDAAVPAAQAALTVDATADQALTAADACHPHLFLRTHDIVDATNAAVWHVLRPIGLAGRIAPRRRDHRTGVWERVIDGFTFRYTVTKTGDQSFSAELDVKHAFQAKAGVRTGIVLGPRSGSPGRFAAYFGDMRANAFALAPGIILLYERNVRTAEELDRHGYHIVYEDDLLLGRTELETWTNKKYALQIQGHELSRARGGPRCMTMPLEREDA